MPKDVFNFPDLNHSLNTQGKHIKTIKTFLNEAYERNYHTNFAYKSKKFKTPKETPEKIYLTDAELTAIYNLDLSNNALLRLPKEIAECPNLKHINLLGNNNIDWQDCFEKVKNIGITSVYVSVYYLDSIPEKYWKLITGIKLINYRVVYIPENILQAIASHTILNKRPQILDKILYVADISEPGRKFCESNKIREIAFRNLDEAVILSINISFKYLMEGNLMIHPITVYARNFLIKGEKYGEN